MVIEEQPSSKGNDECFVSHMHHPLDALALHHERIGSSVTFQIVVPADATYDERGRGHLGSPENAQTQTHARRGRRQ